MGNPVVVGHRGFKSKYVENTIQGFEECYKTGATVIETDIWLSQDKVLVVSHDVNTNRIFCDQEGNSTDYNILETDYNPVLKNLNIIDSDESLLSFTQLLNWFVDYVETSGKTCKIMLDLKPLNPTKLLKFLIKDLLSVKNDITWWFDKIQLGLWKLDFIKYLNQDAYFKSIFTGKGSIKQFDIFHITFSWRQSLIFLNYNKFLDLKGTEDYKIKTTGVSLIYLATWSTDFITEFLPIIKGQNLKLYTWTINFERQFDYFTKLAAAANITEYGVISDSPDIIEKWKSEKTMESPTTPTLSWSQKVSYTIFHKIVGDIYIEEDYESIIDENKALAVQPNSYAKWVFQKLQHLGVL